MGISSGPKGDWTSQTKGYHWMIFPHFHARRKHTTLPVFYLLITSSPLTRIMQPLKIVSFVYIDTSWPCPCITSANSIFSSVPACCCYCCCLALLSPSPSCAVLSFSLILSFFQLPPTNHLTGKVLPSPSECCSLAKLLDPAIANWASSPSSWITSSQLVGSKLKPFHPHLFASRF